MRSPFNVSLNKVERGSEAQESERGKVKSHFEHQHFERKEERKSFSFLHKVATVKLILKVHSPLDQAENLTEGL